MLECGDALLLLVEVFLRDDRLRAERARAIQAALFVYEFGLDGLGGRRCPGDFFGAVAGDQPCQPRLGKRHVFLGDGYVSDLPFTFKHGENLAFFDGFAFADFHLR